MKFRILGEKMFDKMKFRKFSLKKNVFVVALLVMLFASYSLLISQTPEWQWAQQAGGTDIDEARAIKVDANGNSYVTGSFEGTATFGTTTLISNGNKDIFVAKMDVDGNWQWAIKAGGAKKDVGRGITVDASGNSYVTGSFRGTATFGAETLNGTIGLMGELETIFVTKIDTDGNWQWASKAGGGWANDWGDDIEVDAYGNSYITGCFLWYAVFGSDTLKTDDCGISPPPPPGGWPTGGYHWDVFVAKMDADGNWLWAKNAGGSSTSADEGFGIVLDASGNLHITGDYYETAFFGPDSLISNGQSDIFVAEMDTAGNWLWVTSAGGTSTDWCYGLSVDAYGNSYVIGQFHETATFGTTTLTENFSSGLSFGDIFVAKMDAYGDWQWAKSVGDTLIDYGFGISTDANGNSYVTGMFEETAIFGATTLVTSDIAGDCDVFAAKIDTDGNWLWAKQAGGEDSGGDFGQGISIDANGNSYVTGSFQGAATFGSTILNSDGDKDIFVAKVVVEEPLSSFTENFDGVTPPAIPADWTGVVEVLISNTIAEISTTMNGAAPSAPNTSFIMNGLDGSNGQLDPTAFVALVTPLVEVGDNGSTLTFWAQGGNPLIVGTMSDPSDTTTFTAIEEFALDYNFAEFTVPITTRGNTYIAFKHSNTSTCTPLFVDSVTFEQAEAPLTSFTENFDAVTPPALPTDWTFSFDVDLTNTVAEVSTTIHAYAPSQPNALLIMNGGAMGSLDEGAFVALVTPLAEVGENGSILTFWFLGTNPIIVGTMSDPEDAETFTQIEEIAPTGTFAEYTVSLTNPGTTYIAFKHGNTTPYQPIFVDNVIFEQAIIGDFNSDGYVDAADLQLLGDHWHYVDTDPGWDALYDLVPDGIIDAADLQVFGDHWHEGTPQKSGEGGKDGKGPNVDAGIVFDLDATTYGNQNLTSIPSQPAGTHIRVDVYCTGVQNLDTYEFEVIYDPTELAYVVASASNMVTLEPNILTTNGGTAIGWMIDSSTPGVLGLAYTLTGTDPAQAPEGEGLIADIVFLSLVDTYGTLSFGDVYYYDSYGVVDLITDTGTATLPVELSAFTATYNITNGYTTLAWTTASENDVIGFNVYRSTEDEFDTSKKINAEIIAGHGTTTEINTYEFVDLDQLNFGATYYYWLESVEFGGISIVYSSINMIPEEGSGGFVDDFEDSSLSNYPNPFKGSTTISYSIKGMLRSEPVEINIYNMLGQLVDTVEGRYGTATWNTRDHATGIYFYKLNTESYSEIRKMMVTK